SASCRGRSGFRERRRMGERRRGFITGLGAITAAGPTVAELCRALRGAESFIRPLRRLDAAGLKVGIAGEVEPIPEPTGLPRGARVHASRSDRFALVAAEEAVAASGLEIDEILPERIAVAIGSSTGGMLEVETFFEAGVQHRPPGRARAQL